MSNHVNGSNANGTADGISPKITLYTNHGCPWAHRAHIALKCLNLPYEEVIIPLDRPRDQWYLDLNPRGLVPALKISNTILHDEILTESLIISTFLADTFPKSSFYPPSRESPTSGLARARMNLFIDTWFTKVNTLFYPTLKAEGDEKEELGRQLAAAVEKEIEPLLEGAGPFFGGSEVMTFAEAMTAPFLIRYQTFSANNSGLIPPSLSKTLTSLPHFSKWGAAVCAEESVTGGFGWDDISKKVAERLRKLGEGNARSSH